MSEKPSNSVMVLEEPGKLVRKSVGYPECRADGVIIKVNYVGVCGSDLHAFRFGPYIKPSDPNQEVQLGHECAGTVVEVGSEVKNLSVGDHVVIEPGVPCGKCSFCKDGRYNLCENMDFMATGPNYRGALTEYLAYPAHMTYKLPEGLDLEKAALIEPAAVGLHAVKLSKAGLGDKVVILGSGTIGLTTLLACKLVGVEDISVVDVSDSKLMLAKELGASQVYNSASVDIEEALNANSPSVDVVFETAGAKQTAMLANRIVKRGGRIMIVGTIPEEVPINFLKINREVIIQTVFRYANNFGDVIDALASNRLLLEKMISRRYPYAETEAAFKNLVDQRMTLVKGVIEINQQEEKAEKC